jgi:CheY-like chemotaxis protein
VRVRRQVVTVPRILVADDNTNIQKMVVLAFEERGVDVITVGNGEAAVRRIPDANPDLILADVFMPVRNGYEVCEFVKKDTRFAHVPVILLVGAFDPLDEKEARRVGADGVLKKPFVPPDPLIAMVMSALEKNPKVAAELAKAREVPVAPPPPPVMEIPTKAEPKPLPSFPEPTADEAAAIYGFGKGVRSLDDEPEAEKARGPKAPVAKAKDEEEEDDFDGAATATDWRRTGGMDFDIPDNTAVDPAYSYGKDLAPITFPSEKDVPPKKIHVRDEDEAAQPAAPPQQIEARQEESQSFAPYGMKLSTDEDVSNQDAPAPWHESPAFQSAANRAQDFEEETVAPPPGIEPPARKAEAVPEQIHAAAPQKESQPAPPTPTAWSAPPPASRWTDLSAPPSEYPEGSWMSESSTASQLHRSEPAPVHSHEPVASAPSQAAPLSEPSPAPWASSPSSEPESAPPPLASSWHSEPAWNSQPAPAPAAPALAEPQWHSKSEAPRSAENENAERPKKKSWFSDAIEAVREVVHGGAPDAVEQPISSAHAEPEPEPEPVAAAQAESTALVFQPSAPVSEESSAPSVTESASRFEDHARSESSSHSDSQLLSAPADTAPSRKDPALEVPAAARVTPEPLLVRDEHPASSQYIDQPESVAPLQSFPLPGASEPVNGESASDLVSTSHEEVPAFVAAAADSAPSDFSERIPTAPPPNREALSGIPFLMPTAAALESANSSHAPAAAEAAPAPNIDEMVQKVLERLEPQLHELLSKSLLKPLVENMLQAELAKKDK